MLQHRVIFVRNLPDMMIAQGPAFTLIKASGTDHTIG